MGLTGAYQFRKGLLGKTVLQVEEEGRPSWFTSGAVKWRWRDATAADLADPAIRFPVDTDTKAALGLSARGSGGGLGGLPRQREQDSGHWRSEAQASVSHAFGRSTQEISPPTREEALHPLPMTLPRKGRFGTAAFTTLAALVLGVAGGLNLHRLVDLDQTGTWLQQTGSSLQSSLVLLRQEVATRIMPRSPSSAKEASQPAPWKEPNGADIVERMSGDLSKKVDQVRQANEDLVRDLGQGIERIRSLAEQNRRDLIAKLGQLGERLERIERHSPAAMVVNRSQRQPLTPRPRPVAKPIQHPVPPARVTVGPTQTSAHNETKSSVGALADWTVRNVVDDVAVLAGPMGHTVVGVGDRIPGIGRVQAIKRSGRDWVVATTKGVIKSRTPAEPASEPSTAFW